MAIASSAIGWAITLAVSSLTAASIVNSAAGTYGDARGNVYGTTSNTASQSLAAVASLVVTPKESQPNPSADSAASGTVVTRTFTIANTSNIPDAYVISAVTVSAGSVQSVSFTPAGAAPIAATVGTTVSPSCAPGAAITVAVAVATAGVAVGTEISITLTAKTTAPSADGVQSDRGEAWIVVAAGPQIVGVTPPGGSTSPSPTSAPIAVLVDGSVSVPAEPGAALNFRIPFINVGGSPAMGVVVTDQLPAALAPVVGSVSLAFVDRATGTNVSVSGTPTITLTRSTLTAIIPTLPPGIVVSIVFTAALSASAPIGTTVTDGATISAQSTATMTALPAVVFVGATNTVFDALAGSSRPVADATVSLVNSGGALAQLPAVGTPVNPRNANPFSTAASGLFGFALPAAAGQTAYDLDVSAGGYERRTIRVTVQTGADGLPTTTLRALDGQPLAVAGGFALTSSPVTIAGASSFLGNIPLVRPNVVALTFTVDRTIASAGDRLGYTLVFGPGTEPLAYPARVTVALPPGVAYAHGSARLASVAREPIIAGRTLSWPVTDVVQSRTLRFDAVVLPTVTQGVTVTTHATVAVDVAGVSLAANATVGVAIVGGALGARTIISGRVFADRIGDGRFTPGDSGIAGVRIFLEDGESVQTDRDGRFSFPAARPGMHVLHLDPSTLPPGMRAYHGFPVNDPRSSLQLVHGIFDSGLMSDVNFAVSAGR